MTNNHLLGMVLFVALIYAGDACSEEITGPVARVVDADTLIVNDTRIRLWGVDAPEMGTAAGRAATQWAKGQWLGKRVVCRKRAVDRFKRTVAQCFRYVRDGTRSGVSDLGFELVRAGHGVDVPRYSKGYYGE